MTNINDYNNALYNKIIKDSDILEFIEKNSLSPEYVLDHINLFNDAFESNCICSRCIGLQNCGQKRKGEKLTLTYDGVLFPEIFYCQKGLQKMNEDHLINRFVYSDIPDEYKDLSLDNISLPDDNIKRLFLLCFDIYQKNRTKGLYICGNLGVGKTYMCMALANSLNKKGNSVSFVKTTSFINNMRRLVVNDSLAFDKTMQRIKECEYLILDDIGAESVSSFSRDDVLFDILDHRMENHLCTIFTSNLPKNDLYLHYIYDKNDNSSKMRAKRLIERITVLSDDFILDGVNKRLGKNI